MSRYFILLVMIILILGFVSTAQAQSKVIGPYKDQGGGGPRGAPSPVPEPVTLALLGGGLVGLYGLKKKLDKD